MNKTIPTTFDIVLLDNEPTQVAESLPNAKRVNVGVFYKYGNRNGSYITDEMAQHFINNCHGIPLVGFYDGDTSSWAGHTGPKLARGYGYVEDFIGWTQRTDTDGVTRDYATFSVVTFSDYFEEVKSIRGLNQSMELDPKAVDGEWTEIDGQEYFIYSKADMYALCIIGSHEPCFSASTFFSKHESELNEMSSLLFELRQQIDKLRNEGGETMEENINTIVSEEPVDTIVEEAAEPVIENFEEQPAVVEETVEEQPEVTTEEPVVEEPAAEQFENEEEVVEVEETPAVVEETPVVEEAESIEPAAPVVETNYEEAYHNLQSEIEQLRAEMAELKATYEAIITEKNAVISSYELKEQAVESARKQTLLNKYEKVLTREEIDEVGQLINDFSYDDIESKLAVLYSRKNMEKEEASTYVPQVNFENNDMYAFMAKYKKKTK